MPVSVSTSIRRHAAESGRWVAITPGTDGVTIEIGSTGNLLDPHRRVLLARYLLGGRRGRLALRMTWPVAEILSHRVGRFVDDLRAELVAADSPDPDGDLADLSALVTDADGDDLVAQLLTASYPLLTVPIERGARPRAVPLALEPMLRGTDVRAAAVATLGPRVTRPLVRALADALLPRDDGVIAWEPVLCARMAADRCGPEQLADILTTTPFRVGTVSFSMSDIERARVMFADVNPRRVSESLCAALRDERGMADLVARLAGWNALPPRPPEPATPVMAPAPQVTVAARVADPMARPIEYPAWWRSVDGMAVADFRVVLPRTPNELLEWGLDMDNCLGSYRGAVAAGRSRIIGFTRNGHLRFAAEVSPGGVLRTLEAPHNVAPYAAESIWLLDFLRAQGLVGADGRRS